jgi:hypothetical protein
MSADFLRDLAPAALGILVIVLCWLEWRRAE